MWWVAALRDGFGQFKEDSKFHFCAGGPKLLHLFIIARLHLSNPWISASLNLPNSFICSSLNSYILPSLVPLVSAHFLGGWPELHTGVMRLFSTSVGWPHFDNSFRNYTGTTLGLGHREHTGPRCHLSVNAPQMWGFIDNDLDWLWHLSKMDVTGSWFTALESFPNGTSRSSGDLWLVCEISSSR